MTKNNSHTTIALMQKDIEYMKKGMERIEKTLEGMKSDFEKYYVTKIEFSPIKRIVYGIVSLVLIAVVGALISLVV